MPKAIKITESQYKRLLLSEDLDSACELTGGEYNSNGSYVIKSGNKEYLFGKNISKKYPNYYFGAIKDSDGNYDKFYYNCETNKIFYNNINNKILSLSDELKNINSTTNNKENKPNDIKSGGNECYKDGYLHGVVKSIGDKNFTINPPLKNSSWNGGNCYVCYKYYGEEGSTTTNICFSENKSYFVETIGINDSVLFTVDDIIKKGYNLPEDFSTNYISYVGAWSTTSFWNKSLQIISLHMGVFKLSKYEKNGEIVNVPRKGNIKVSKNMSSDKIIKIFTNNKSTYFGDISLEGKSLNDYKYLSNLLTGWVSRDEFIDSLKYISDSKNFNSCQDYATFNNLLKSSGKDTINQLIDNVSFKSEGYKHLKTPLFNVLFCKEDWSELKKVVEEIEKILSE